MTGCTQTHEVALVMGAAPREGNDMVNFLGGRQLASFFTLLAKRMRRDIAVADTLPCPAVAFFSCRIALVLFVLLVSHLLMRRTIPPVRKCRTARVTARALGFLWHSVTSRAKQKALGAGAPKALCR